ncbi:hypothetical protein Trydic_g7542 [Trypoxylus dichotomus]
MEVFKSFLYFIFKTANRKYTLSFTSGQNDLTFKRFLKIFLELLIEHSSTSSIERPVDQLTGHRPWLIRLGVVAIATNTQPVPFLQVATIGLQFVDQSLRHYGLKYPIRNSVQNNGTTDHC